MLKFQSEIKRVQEWLDFTDHVEAHIEEYTVSQYGDKEDDYLTDKDPQFCIDQIERYCKRFGKQKRSNEELLDLIKMAHYICVAWHKIKEMKDDINKT